MKVKRLIWCLAGINLLIICLGDPIYAQPPSRSYAIVIANNASLNDQLKPLRFADDDGAKYFELLRAAGAEVTLLAVLDEDAQHRYRGAAASAKPPNRKTLQRTLEKVFAQIELDQRAGVETHFFFVYSGHGHLGPNQEGMINLLDAPFSRSQLFREVIAPSPATYNHLILDACNAYFMVEKKGGTTEDRVGNFRAVIDDFLHSEELSSYPNTGVILAASSESETHEWGLWEAGIFSHELRSALLGAADINGDQQVTYQEAAACVDAANAAIRVPKARLRIYYRPPAIDIDQPLIDLNRLTAPSRLHFPKETAQRYYVEDSRGIRVLDFNFTPEQPLQIALLGEPPFFLRTKEREARIDAASEPVLASDLVFEDLCATCKGGIEMTFRRYLFAIPYGRGFYRGVNTLRTQHTFKQTPTAGTTPMTDEDAPRRNLSKLALGGMTLGVLTGISGGIIYYAANQSYKDYQNATTTPEVLAHKETTNRRLLAARIMIGTGAALALAGTVMMIREYGRQKKKDAPVVQADLGVGPTGFIAGVRGRW